MPYPPETYGCSIQETEKDKTRANRHIAQSMVVTPYFSANLSNNDEFPAYVPPFS